jgi:peptidoglycan hydrolase-like amidase
MEITRVSSVRLHRFNVRGRHVLVAVLSLLASTTALASTAAASIGRPASVRAVGSATVTLDGQVRNGEALYGRAIIVPEGLPVVADATVSIPRFKLSATTDSHGDFALRIPAASARLPISVVVTARGFGNWRESGVKLATSGATSIYVQLSHVAQSFTAPRAGGQSYNGRGTLMRGSGVRKQQAVSSIPDSSSACDGNSSGWTSQKETPPIIRVYMTGTGDVVDYSFEFYEEHVLPNEWSGDNPEAALQAGAEAIRDYAWYFVLNGSKGTTANANVNPCTFDVDDSTAYQNFEPSAPTYTSTDDAVTSTATTVFAQNGVIPETSYCSNLSTGCGADSPADTCGKDANGTTMSQIGSVACADNGDTWQEILGFYYYSGYSLTNDLTAYPFWMGGPDSGNALWEGQGPATGSLSGPYNRGMGPLNSAPAVAIGQNGYIYAYWEGGPDSGYDLWEAYWNGSSWLGPYNRGMGPLDSAPTVTVSPRGTAYVLWEGGPDSGNALWEATGPATGSLSGPDKIGMGPLNSAPTAGMDGDGNIDVYWEGGPGSGNALWEAYWNGSSWLGPYNRGMGPLNSQPSVAVAADGTVSVFWEGGPDSGNALWEATGPGNGSLSGPYNLGMGPLDSAPTAGADVNGYPYIYWEGGPDSGNALWQAYWNGSSWQGPFNRGMGPLGSPPAVAIFS